MIFKIQTVFRPEESSVVILNGDYSDEALKSTGFYFETPIETIEAEDRYEAGTIQYDKYIAQAKELMHSPKATHKFF